MVLFFTGDDVIAEHSMLFFAGHGVTAVHSIMGSVCWRYNRTVQCYERMLPKVVWFLVPLSETGKEVCFAGFGFSSCAMLSRASCPIEFHLIPCLLACSAVVSCYTMVWFVGTINKGGECTTAWSDQSCPRGRLTFGQGGRPPSIIPFQSSAVDESPCSRRLVGMPSCIRVHLDYISLTTV